MYSCVAVWKNGRVEICPNEQGNRITPSYVAWTPNDGQRLVGDAAKNQAASNPINTIFDVKRLIGRKFSDSSVQRDAKLLPYKSKPPTITSNCTFFLITHLTVVSGTGDKPMVSVKVGTEDKTFSPEEISAMVNATLFSFPHDLTNPLPNTGVEKDERSSRDISW